jgi:DHA1 family bicyclomycin/chloramphenicol resistance-like MFS transporter
MTGLSALAISVFLPSLPRMAEEFGAGYGVLHLSIALILAVNAVLQIAAGPLSARFGRRPVLLAGFAHFILASAGCALATWAAMFPAFRMFQAAVVVAMALSRAIVCGMYAHEQSASVLG